MFKFRKICFQYIAILGLGVASAAKPSPAPAPAPAPVHVESIDKITFMTEEYPPYSFSKDGQHRGIAVDILLKMLELMGSKVGRQDIKVLPWPRGYALTLKTKDTCLFAMTGTKERAKLFKFVGPLESFDSAALFGKKSRHFKIDSYKDIVDGGYSVGVVRDDIVEIALREHGVTNITTGKSAESLAKMVEFSRIDLWGYGASSVQAVFKSSGLNSDEYENVFSLATGDSFFAFHIETSDATIHAFQKVFDDLKREGFIKQVYDNYIGRGG